MPTFDGVAEYAAEGCLVKPVMLQFFLESGIDFKFKLHLQRSGWRAPDGWFHASTHPLASEHELWAYIAHPELITEEPRSYEFEVAVLMGTILHGFFEAALKKMGVMVPLPAGLCAACGREYLPKGKPQSDRYCLEHGASDLATRSRGHLDGILNFGVQGTFGFDLKSIRPYGLKGVRDMDAGAFRDKWPKYWAQMQEYMRLTGLRKFIVLFMEWGTPWTMKEFHVEFDPVFAAQTEAKYRRVLAAVEAGEKILDVA
jgi:hypothetical protein